MTQTPKPVDLALLKDADTILMADGEIDAGIALMEALVELRALRALVGSDMPICPYCKVRLRPRTYKGYYESFDYWGCDCSALPQEGKTTVTGYCG